MIEFIEKNLESIKKDCLENKDRWINSLTRVNKKNTKNLNVKKLTKRMVAGIEADELVGMCHPSGGSTYLWLGTIFIQPNRSRSTSSGDLQSGQVDGSGTVVDYFIWTLRKFPGQKGTKG